MNTEQRQAAILRHMNWNASDTDSTLLLGPDGHYLFNDAAKMFYRWPSLDALALVESSLDRREAVTKNGVIYSSQACLYAHYILAITLDKDIKSFWWPSLGPSAFAVFECTTATFDQRLHALCLTLGLEEVQ